MGDVGLYRDILTLYKPVPLVWADGFLKAVSISAVWTLRQKSCRIKMGSDVGVAIKSVIQSENVRKSVSKIKCGSHWVPAIFQVVKIRPEF